MSRTRLLLVGLLTFVIGLVVYLPARLALNWLPIDSAGVQLSGVQGTLLHGSAKRVVTADFAIDNLHWRLNPGALLLGRLSADVRLPSDQAALTANAAYTLWGTTTVSAINGQASLGWLARRGGYADLPLAGDVRLRDVSITLDSQQQATAISGQLQLTNARLQLTQPGLTMGDYTARLAHENNQLKLTLTDSSGPLAIKGSGSYAPGTDRYTLDVRLRARAGADKRLPSLLATIGDRDHDGWYPIHQQGRFY